MTTEEKAKAYDKAMERAKEMYDTYRFSVDPSNFKPTDLEYIFPKLHESEDERIRKALIAHFTNNCVSEVWAGLDIPKVIAWLENQKEQKDFRKLYEDIAKSEWFKKAYEGKSLGCDDEQKEQKSVKEVDNLHNYLYGDNEKSTEENKQLHDIVIAELSKYNATDFWKAPWALDSTGLQYPLYFANLGAKWQKEQKPAEWSEEDKSILDEAIAMIEARGCWIRSDDAVKRVSNFLKSLRPQPKEDWSAEDEAILGLIQSAVDAYSYDSGSIKTYFKICNWLKNLRPQAKHKQEEIVLHWENGHPEPYKPVLILRHGKVVVEGEWNEETGRWYQYRFQSHLTDNEVDGWMDEKSLLFGNFNFHTHWKPSEEQMKALRYYLNHVPYSLHKEHLSSLRDDCEKLFIQK